MHQIVVEPDSPAAQLNRYNAEKREAELSADDLRYLYGVVCDYRYLYDQHYGPSAKLNELVGKVAVAAGRGF